MNCPQPELLQKLLDESLPADQQPTVQAHLETCAACQKKLEQLAAGGVTWDKTAENLADRPKRDETALFDALEKLQDTPTSAVLTQAEGSNKPIDDDLSFLQPSPKPNSLGRLDEYEILSVVGKGGFGIVLKAFDESLHRVVAIKVMSPHIAANGTARQRFIREAQAAAAITHENVVTIHAVNKVAKIPYLAMQFVSGVTLNEKIDKAGCLSVKEVLRIGMQIAEGLAAAHKQGVVHRDIKPGNILLENGVERVKITDFGLARVGDDASISQSGSIAGTPMYMSPEQAKGEQADPRSDLFSLGSVLYVMCTGRPPFRATSAMAVMKRVCDETPTPVQQVNAEIPDWLADVITKLHAKKAAGRYQTAKEVAELLGQHLARIQQPAVTNPAAPAETAEISVRSIQPPVEPERQRGTRGGRRWAMVAVAAAGFLALCAVVIAVFWQRPGNVAVVLRAEDVLPRLIGTWSVELKRTLPGPITRRGVIRYEWVADGKFLRAYASYEDGQEILTVYRYDPESKGFRRWSIASTRGPQAIQVAGEGQFDAKTQTLTWRDSWPLFQKVVAEDRWIDQNTCETRAEVKDHQGAMVERQMKKMNRIGDRDVKPALPPDPTRPAELTVLDRLVGSWTTKADVTLAEMGDQKVKSQSTHEVVPILAGRFFEAHEHTKPGDREDYWLVGYDENRKTYRFWHFGGDGESLEADGAWDKTESKLTWKSLDGRLAGSWTLAKPDERHTTMTAKDAQGRRLYEVTAISKRNVETADGWVQLFNGKDLTGWERLFSRNSWSVEDRLMVGQSPPNHLLTKRDDFENFHLRAEVKINKGGNSGVFFRCKPSDGVPRSGYEVEIALGEPNATGSLLQYPGKPWVLHQERKDHVSPDTWFLLEIIAQGGQIVTKVNGKKCADVMHDAYRKGRIELQVFGGNTLVHFRKIEIKELPPSKTAEPASPFVILAKDAKIEQKFATLADAVAAAKSGETIEIRGNGPFVTKPILLQKKALTIRAGSGALPVLRLTATDAGPLLETDAPLVLEGLNLQAGVASGKAGRRWLVFARTAPVYAANCRFSAGPFWGALLLSETPTCHLHNCELLGADLHVAVEWVCPPGGRLVVENCAFLAKFHGLMFHQRKVFDKDVTLQMRRTTLVSDMPINYWCQAPVRDVLDGIAQTNCRPLRLEIEECIFDPYWHVVDFRQVDQAQALDAKAAQTALPKLLTWSGRRNLYPASNHYLFLSALRNNAEAQPWAAAPDVLRLTDWIRFWGNTETGAIEGRIQFQGGSLAAKARPDPERLQAIDFRLPPDSAGKGAGKDGKDLGADVDLVGPGAAYEKWKTTPDYQQWLNDTGQAKPEPAWVQLFRGKDFDNWQGDTNLVRWHEDTLFLSSTNAKQPGLSNVVNRKVLRDFELEFDIKMGKETGLIHLPVSVQVRGAKHGLAGPSELLVGYQLDVRPKFFGDLHHRSVTQLKRVKVSAAAHSPAKVVKKNDFNHVRIRCESHRLTVQLNGFTTLDEVLADMPQAGLLSFHWSSWTEVLLQNIRLRELSNVR